MTAINTLHVMLMKAINAAHDQHDTCYMVADPSNGALAVVFTGMSGSQVKALQAVLQNAMNDRGKG